MYVRIIEVQSYEASNKACLEVILKSVQLQIYTLHMAYVYAFNGSKIKYREHDDKHSS